MNCVKEVNFKMLTANNRKHISIMQNDCGMKLKFNITDYDIADGVTARIWVMKPSKKLVYNDCVIDGNSVIAQITNQITAECGLNAAKIELHKNSSVVSSEFILELRKDFCGNGSGTESKNESTVLDDMFDELSRAVQEKINAANEATQKANAAIANANTATQNANNAAEEARTAIWNNKNLTDRHIGSSIKAEGTVAASAIIKELSGKTEQVQTKGYQLFDASKLPTKSQGGATVANNGDGSFTISGSGTLSELFDINIGYNSEEAKKLLKVGNLTLLCEQNSTPFVFVSIYSSSGNLQISNKYGTTETKEITQEIYDNISSMHIQFTGAKNETITPGTIRPMLYQDGDGTWEPFTGGKPSPSPEYPQEVEGVGDGGSVTVVGCGRNLVDSNSIENMTIKEGRTDRMKIHVVANTPLYASLVLTDGTVCEPYGVDFSLLDENGNSIIGSIQLNKIFTVNKNQATKIRKCHIYFNSNYVGKKIKYFKVEEGSAITEGEPYYESKIQISLSLPLYEGDKLCYMKPGERYIDVSGNTVVADRMLYGVWRENTKITFDGSDDEQYALSNVETTPDYFRVIAPKIPQKEYTNCLSNNLFVRTEEAHGFFEYIMASTSTYIQIAKSRLSTQDVFGFKTWLASNPVTVVYKLAVPYFEPFADQSVFCNLRSADELTYIYTEDPLEPTVTVDVAKTPEGAYLLDGFCVAEKNSIDLEQTAAQLTSMLSLMPASVQAEMIENDITNLLESEGL